MFNIFERIRTWRDERFQRKYKDLLDDGYGYIMTQHFLYKFPLDKLQEYHDGVRGPWHEHSAFDEGCDRALRDIPYLKHSSNLSAEAVSGPQKGKSKGQTKGLWKSK